MTHPLQKFRLIYFTLNNRRFTVKTFYNHVFARQPQHSDSRTQSDFFRRIFYNSRMIFDNSLAVSSQRYKRSIFYNFFGDFKCPAEFCFQSFRIFVIPHSSVPFLLSDYTMQKNFSPLQKTPSVFRRTASANQNFIFRNGTLLY